MYQEPFFILPVNNNFKNKKAAYNEHHKPLQIILQYTLYQGRPPLLSFMTTFSATQTGF